MRSRREFLQAAGVLGVETVLGPRVRLLASAGAAPARKRSKNDTVQIALIGAGGQGMYDTSVALQVDGTRLVAVSDCYDGRLTHSKERWGQDVFTTRNYKEVLAREDVDAVIIGTPDHWHKDVAIDAMRAGKDVYCEKPMIHVYEDGPAMIAAAKETGRVIEVGSQRVSSVIYAKAKELLASGAIGQLNMVTAFWDRNSAIGAWEYTIPLDASEQTCDWPQFEGSAPKHAWDAERFFQWRKYKDYGSGVAGDLFVHLFSGTNFVTGALGPTRAMATGGLRYWKDGRDVPDVLLALFDYPEGFNLHCRVNFVDGGEESEGLVFTGSEGTMEISGHGVSVRRSPRETQPGLTVGTFAEAMQKATTEAYQKKYPPKKPTGETSEAEERYVAPQGYSDSYDHFRNFFAAVRGHGKVVEDAEFGYRAAGAALLSNLSYERDQIVHWDPKAMKLVQG